MGPFPTTSWTLIASARPGDASRGAALEELFSRYWKPLYFYLRRKGLTREAAEDAVQGFVAHLLEGDFPARAAPDKGRFRAYVRVALDHYVANLYAKESARKRGGDHRFVPIDVVLAERELPDTAADPLCAFEREWAIGVMERAALRLRREHEERHGPGRASVILQFFELGRLASDSAPSYATAAVESGLSVVQLKAALHRARARFREILRDEVTPTLSEPADVEAELSALRRALEA